MAQKYGGKYSPDGAGQSQAPARRERRRVDPAGGRANLMFVPALVLAFTSFGDGAAGLALGLTSAATLVLSAWFLREGLRAEAAFHERKIARRPALPRKIVSSLLAGCGIAIAAYANEGGILGAGLYGVITALLHSTAFGLDPLSNKNVEGVDLFQQDRVARVVDEAEAYLTAMSAHIASLRDRKLELRVAEFINEARDMIRTVEEDPRDLTGSRKFLGVYLMGARDATVKFVEHQKRSPDQKARDDYEALLTDLHDNFAAKTREMLIDDRTDMDIEIKVLRDRLQREGVKPN